MLGPAGYPDGMRGCFTALITPLTPEGRLDDAALEKLVEFQLSQGVAGILAVGTTGESPTLDWNEHNAVIERVCGLVKGRGTSIAGTGSNNTREALRATEHAAEVGADAALLVDPYYNGPSSLEIRREYVAPIAEAFPGLTIIPYVIPGRTGAQLLPEDLGLLRREFENVRAVKEATGDLENMARTRACCGDDFDILSGDDNRTFAMMTDERIRASGVISVMSNVVPGAVQRLTEALASGDAGEATRLRDVLAPLFGMVGVTTTEPTPLGDTTVKARNPLPLKTLMNMLGMPAGPCRRPLGRMTAAGLKTVLANARAVHAADLTVFAPLAAFFDVDVEKRLEDEAAFDALVY